MIGAYGPWAAGLVGEGPARLSFRQPRFQAGESTPGAPERGSGSTLACSSPTRAGSRKPGSASARLRRAARRAPDLAAPLRTADRGRLPQAGRRSGRLPAVLGLHDHGGNKYFGWRKIAQISDQLHPMMKEHRDEYYGGVSWANELAKRGFAVLVHDAFAFASRRVRVGDLPPVIRKDLKEVNPESEEEIKAYNNSPPTTST